MISFYYLAEPYHLLSTWNHLSLLHTDAYDPLAVDYGTDTLPPMDRHPLVEDPLQ
jgi:hypothetical protein